MPTVLLDKSAFEALRPEEHELLGRFTHQIIPPLLIMEILGDAAKDVVPGRNPWIQVLARKFNGSGDPIAGEWELIMQGSLLGKDRPIHKQIPVTNCEFRRAQDGTLGMVIQSHPLNDAILRWARGQISQIEFLDSIWWRKTQFLLDVDAYCAWVTDDQVALPRAKDAKHAVDLADRFLREPGMARFWIGRASELSGHNEEQTSLFLNRPFSSSASFSEVCPLAYRIMLGFLSTLIAWQSKHLRTDLNNAKDAMYFSYLPFAACFVSDDSLHRRLAPLMMDENQVFLTSEELRLELALIQKVLDENLIQISHGLPIEVRQLADSSKLVKVLCHYLRPTSMASLKSRRPSMKLTSADTIRNRILNSAPISPPDDNEEVQWIFYESTLSRSVAEQRFGESNLPPSDAH